MKKTMLIVSCIISVLIFTQVCYSHCQIPCGIYDDEARFAMIAEDITTIEKSMNEIISLSKKKEKNYNQIVRWIENKEVHADKIMNTVTYYFMAQRIKPVPSEDVKGYKQYQDKITVLHQMLVYAMESKQTTDLKNVKKLRELLKQFHELYHKHSNVT
ncbi:MAG: superoxide dismutase [Ni] [Candidatus Ancaeobacter aquaticus]|nr:superoxide dismutase [Ni] [Candidatus Ancaeobacter aquaticus]